MLWSSDYGITLVDKWTEEDRLVATDTVTVSKLNKALLASYWTPLGEHIVPKTKHWL